MSDCFGKGKEVAVIKAKRGFYYMVNNFEECGEVIIPEEKLKTYFSHIDKLWVAQEGEDFDQLKSEFPNTFLSQSQLNYASLYQKCKRKDPIKNGFVSPNYIELPSVLQKKQKK